MTATITPIHPGEVLLEEFLGPLGVTQHHLAVSIGVPPRRINEIVHAKRSITADTALRLLVTSDLRGTIDIYEPPHGEGTVVELRVPLDAAAV